MLPDTLFPFEVDLLRVHCDCYDPGDGQGPRQAGPFGFHPASDADQREVIQDGPHPVVLYRVAEDTRNLALFRKKTQVCWVVVEGSRNTNQWNGRILDAAEAADIRGKPAEPPATPMPLKGNDRRILEVLADHRGELLTQEQIEGAILKKRIPGVNVGLRTIQRRLPILCEWGLVARPAGGRSGYLITDPGLAVAHSGG